MNTKKIDSNRWEKIWILLSAAAGSSGVYFAFGSVFDPAADIRMFGIGMLMFVICWFPYVWMEKYVWMWAPPQAVLRTACFKTER